MYPADATYPNVTWTTSDSDIAVVDENGMVETKASGSAISQRARMMWLKSRMFGRFYLAYVWGNYDWDMFRQLSAANQKLFFNDYEILNFIGLRSVSSKEITSMQRRTRLWY